MDLVRALDYYDQHGFIMFWNPQDITPANMATATPYVEALVIEPPSISSAELFEGQYLVEGGKLEPYQSYRGHEGIDKIFEAIKRAGPGFQEMANAAIKQCVSMVSGQWVDGPHPERENYQSFADFADPDGNIWLLQEVDRSKG